MIFYFSGTGNSMYAATELQKDTGEKLINIAEAVKQKQFQYSITSGEKLGFVFPVYFYGLPSIVSWFISKLKLTGDEPEYVYGVITCGSKIGGADQLLEEKLEKIGSRLDAVYPLKMPDNYIVMFDVPDEAKQEEILRAADIHLKSIKSSIASCAYDGYCSNLGIRLLTNLSYAAYKKSRKTKKFWTDDRCIGCGACANRCANNAIRMVDGKPTWIKDRCIFCLGCTNRCGAIQYGKSTVKRGRYVHPILKKPKTHAHSSTQSKACH